MAVVDLLIYKSGHIIGVQVVVGGAAFWHPPVDIRLVKEDQRSVQKISRVAEGGVGVGKDGSGAVAGPVFLWDAQDLRKFLQDQIGFPQHALLKVGAVPLGGEVKALQV